MPFFSASATTAAPSLPHVFSFSFRASTERPSARIAVSPHVENAPPRSPTSYKSKSLPTQSDAFPERNPVRVTELPTSGPSPNGRAKLRLPLFRERPRPRPFPLGLRPLKCRDDKKIPPVTANSEFRPSLSSTQRCR